jgi:uncharacterized protein YndB with AHSA1/START domain
MRQQQEQQQSSAAGTADTDRIERSVQIGAPRSRVWRALSNAEEFGTWFRADLKGQTFRPGQRTRGRILHPGFEHVFFDVVIDRMEPERLLAFRWHPYPADASVDYDKEEPTLVTFTLEDDSSGRGTLLTVTETGFDKVPPHRRLQAFRMNTQGWEGQLRNIVRHVAG